MTVGAIQDRFKGNVKVERASRKGSWMLKVTPELILEADDLVALGGLTETVVRAGEFIGQETHHMEHLGFTAEVRDVVVTRKEILGKTLAEAKEMLDLRGRYGVYATQVFRLDQEIPMYPDMIAQSGDVVRFVGASEHVAQAAQEVGYSLVPSKLVDYVYLGFGVLAGILVGMISVRVAGVPIGLGTGGGCLISGLVFGWLRAKHPTFGNLPGSTAQYLRDFGLAVFIASIGLASGPQAIAQIKQYGVTLPLIGLAVTVFPCLVMVFYGRFVLKMNPVILCGAITGNLTSTPALNGVIDAAESSTPVLGYTVSYAIGNVLLTFLGPVIVYAV
jgi:AspT/YidE/YbjL antiporter-like protein